jgi:hypothetical protein
MPNENQNQSNGDDVVLRKDQYDALLDRLEELEGVQASPTAKEANYENYDDLVQGGQQKEGEAQVTGINEMSNEELLGFINDQFSANAVNPLATQIEGLRLDMEFLKLGGEEGFEDIETVRDKVLETIHENPNMSVEKAYKLVQVDNPKPKEGEEEEKGKGAEILRHLPERVVSEKPGFSGDSTKEKGPETLRDAAEEAFDEAGIQSEQ